MLYNVWYHSSIPRCTIPCNNPVLLVGWILLYMPPYWVSACASLPSPFWNKKQVWQAWKRDREGRRCQRALNVAPNEPCRERSSLELGRLSQIRTSFDKKTNLGFLIVCEVCWPLWEHIFHTSYSRGIQTRVWTPTSWLNYMIFTSQYQPSLIPKESWPCHT